MHERWTDISTSVMLGADVDAPSLSPVLAFSGDADMVMRTKEAVPIRRGVLDRLEMKLTGPEARL